jgi:predicted Zn-ribbon and HTH transcriptional regulator
MVWVGLEHGRKIREFNTEVEAVDWLNRHKHILGKIGKYKGKRVYSIQNKVKVTQLLKCNMCGWVGTADRLYKERCPKCGSKAVWEWER